MFKISLEEAKKIADNEAKKYGKIVVLIEENDEYFRSTAEFENGKKAFDDGVGGVYISKEDGRVMGLRLWDIDFNSKFNDSSKIVYMYDDHQ